MIFRRIDVYFRVIQICRNGIPGAQNCACFEATDWDWEDVEEGLVAETPVVYFVCYVGYFVPGNAAVVGLVDWKVDEGGFGTVVFPSC